ncbi:MAG: carboxymuconolactone decarboxylase family protein [Gammaproteobacteria bacterium]|nr:carboxymuconolactone decarboxylase family protein [Gammaproteobacteria bacterium]
MTIPYQPVALAEPADLVAAIRQRRGGELLNLDRMLLHSPPFARGWNAFLGAVRSELNLVPKLRELAICAVAVVNRADYEFNQHAPLFVRAGGTDAQLQALRTPTEVAASNHFDALEKAVVALTVAMSRDIVVPKPLITELHERLPGDRELVELIGTIAAYNMVSRFLVATGVTPE